MKARVASIADPSHLSKLRRAEKHLIDLKSAVGEYSAPHPYAVAESVEGKKQKKVRRLEFTGDPAETDIPVIAADVVYNLRSSLEHLMGILVPPKERTSTMFPIFFQGVWEAIVPREGEQRVKERARWASVIKSLPPGAVAVLKQLQPPDDGGDSNCLRIINQVSNKDRHRKLPVVAAGLRNVVITGEGPDGGCWEKSVEETFLPDRVAENHAILGEIPDDAMNVKIKGTPSVAIRIAEGGIEVPRELERTAKHVRLEVIPLLEPFLWSDDA